jgi:CheY-like chemotaxis protein
VRRQRILVVEDDPAVRHLIDIVLTCQGHHVILASSAPLANAQLLDFPDHPPAVAVLDLVRPGGTDGLAFADALRQRFPDIRLIFMTGWPDRPDADRAASLGPVLYKPFSMDDLSAALS